MSKTGFRKVSFENSHFPVSTKVTENSCLVTLNFEIYFQVRRKIFPAVLLREYNFDWFVRINLSQTDKSILRFLSDQNFYLRPRQLTIRIQRNLKLKNSDWIR